MNGEKGTKYKIMKEKGIKKKNLEVDLYLHKTVHNQVIVDFTQSYSRIFFKQ